MMMERQEVSKVFLIEIVETYALRDFDLSVNAASLSRSRGTPGCDKTTLLNVIGLLEEFGTDSYCLDGEELRRGGGGSTSRMDQATANIEAVPDIGVPTVPPVATAKGRVNAHVFASVPPITT
jgi:ABC-type lipoprotein export system ATPase subunit